MQCVIVSVNNQEYFLLNKTNVKEK